jgi:transposase
MTYSVKQVRERYAVSPHTVLTWIRDGSMTAVNVARRPGGKPRWRITPEALQTFELLRSAQPVEVKPRRRRKRESANVVEFYK